jgi:hypothetical protein
MSKRDSSNEKSDWRVRAAFAYPFKVLRDIFTDPPFAPEPEFTRFDLNALRDEDSTASSTVFSRGNLARATRRKIRIPILLLGLILVVIALIIVA